MNTLQLGNISDIKFLQLCASITKGMTIYLGNFSLVPINSWWSLLRRRWNLEDRNVVLKYIDFRISKILSDMYIGIETSVQLSDIESVISGLRQFGLTYEEDLNFALELSIIINKMEHIVNLEKEKEGIRNEPEFNPTLECIKESKESDREGNIEKSSVKKNERDVNSGPIAYTLKKIRTWSEMQNRSPPQFNSLLDNIRSPSFDSLNLKRGFDL